MHPILLRRMTPHFVTVNTQPGQYFQFIDNGNGDYGLGLYNSNNTLDRVIHATGSITALVTM